MNHRPNRQERGFTKQSTSKSYNIFQHVDNAKVSDKDHISTSRTSGTSRATSGTGTLCGVFHRSQDPPKTTITKNSGLYGRRFQQHLIDHGIYPHGLHRYEDSDGWEPPRPVILKPIALWCQWILIITIKHNPDKLTELHSRAENQHKATFQFYRISTG